MHGYISGGTSGSSTNISECACRVLAGVGSPSFLLPLVDAMLLLPVLALVSSLAWSVLHSASLAGVLV